jgi:hypothetical protein
MRDGDRYYLTSPTMDNPPAGTKHHEVDERLIRSVNGYGSATHSNFRPVSLAGIYDDETGTTVVTGAAHLEARGAMFAAVGVVTDSSCKAQAAPPPPDPARIALADSNSDVAEALEIMGRVPVTWLDLRRIHGNRMPFNRTGDNRQARLDDEQQGSRIHEFGEQSHDQRFRCGSCAAPEGQPAQTQNVDIGRPTVHQGIGHELARLLALAEPQLIGASPPRSAQPGGSSPQARPSSRRMAAPTSSEAGMAIAARSCSFDVGRYRRRCCRSGRTCARTGIGEGR